MCHLISGHARPEAAPLSSIHTTSPGSWGWTLVAGKSFFNPRILLTMSALDWPTQANTQHLAELTTC